MGNSNKKEKDLPTRDSVALFARYPYNEEWQNNVEKKLGRNVEVCVLDDDGCAKNIINFKYKEAYLVFEGQDYTGRRFYEKTFASWVSVFKKYAEKLNVIVVRAPWRVTVEFRKMYGTDETISIFDPRDFI
jgi:hypothetical protein